MALTPRQRLQAINLGWGEASGITDDPMLRTAQVDIQFLLDWIKADDPHFDKTPYDPIRGKRNGRDEIDDPCGRCGHQYYRHFDWMEDHRPGCKYCPCEEFQEVS